ncbi:MAG: homocysteine S-methyltransferase family protein [Melioribacteraceae bacterium]|nr:homocysteine S-methyltransferase family protein [Melioribacteraceae bacterium]
MRSLLKSLKSGKVLISDGAWGTFLHEKGLKSGECPELWNISNRNAVLEIAKSYVAAGSDMILTNSFGGSPVKLNHYGLEDRAYELNKAAAEISREAAGNSCLVLGSIGPTGKVLMMEEVSESDMYDGFYLQAQALKAGGADAICVETMSAIDEASLAVRAAKKATNLEIICTFTFDKTKAGEYRTMMGVSPAEMVNTVKEAGADVIGTNCGNGFVNMIDIVKEIRNVDAYTPVLVHANAGIPVLVDGVSVFPDTPEFMASHIKELIDCGANIIGGCCGTTPAHIRAMVTEINKISQ